MLGAIPPDMLGYLIFFWNGSPRYLLHIPSVFSAGPCTPSSAYCGKLLRTPFFFKLPRVAHYGATSYSRLPVRIFFTDFGGHGWEGAWASENYNFCTSRELAVFCMRRTVQPCMRHPPKDCDSCILLVRTSCYNRCEPAYKKWARIPESVQHTQSHLEPIKTCVICGGMVQVGANRPPFLLQLYR